MSVTIGNVAFADVDDDHAVDVLYLAAADSAPPVDWDESAEGHGVGFDATGRPVQLTILHPRWLLRHDGVVAITTARLAVRLTARDLAPALAPLRAP